ncbi:hypothetical protein [Aeromicrobium sp.]
MAKETAKLMARMALWTVPLVLIIGAVIAGVVLVVLASWPDF